MKKHYFASLVFVFLTILLITNSKMVKAEDENLQLSEETIVVSKESAPIEEAAIVDEEKTPILESLDLKSPEMTTVTLNPDISIITPVNDTTSESNQVFLDFTANNADECWYDLGGLKIEDGSIGDPTDPSFQYPLPGCASTTITLPNLPNDLYTLNLHGKNSAGGADFDSTWFRVNSVKQCNIISDTSNLVEGDSNAEETWNHTAWYNQGLMGSSAKWIWEAFKVINPTQDEEKVFVKSFNLDSTPGYAILKIAADNGFKVELNDNEIADELTNENNFASPKSYIINNLQDGENTLKITVKNFGLAEATSESNPAGLLYKLNIQGSECTAPSEPVEQPTKRKRSSGSRIVSQVTQTNEGRVLGASTCSPYLSNYIKLGNKNNNIEEVKKLQEFLNAELGLSLVVDGNYGEKTYNAVKAFQVKYSKDILDPWFMTDPTLAKEGTGYVYKTTQRWINMLKCPELQLPMPLLF